MKSLKKISLYFALFLFSYNACFSQTNISNLNDEQKAEIKKDMKEFAASLQLTEEQKPDFVAISKKYGNKMMALKESNSSKWSKYRKVRSINKSRKKEMKKLLSSDQYKTYVKKHEELQKKMKTHLKM